ncbi:unnamed protein product [Lupinus luteus]|uniref:Uncharacterized protein n=1 Tax=Lupinus luteus TaxID=3873 RepID=A0AAV1XBM2_LUPLU
MYPKVHGDVCKAHQSTQHKKQVRRRLHTSRPYQEKLLNMAEARREIVTALKYHRASMKQATEQKQQQQQEVQEEHQRPLVSLQLSQQPSFEQDGRYKSRRNPRIYPSCTKNFPNYMAGFSHSYSPHPPPSIPNSNTYTSASPHAPPPLMADNQNFILPNKTLGLNLNFHEFNNLDATTNLNNSSLSSYSSPTSYSPPLSVETNQDVPSAQGEVEGSSSLVGSIQSCATTYVAGGLHTAMDDEGMAEIRSLGEKYQIEWNDTMNFVKSACWFKFLKKMEHVAPEAKTEDDGAYYSVEELVEFPAWLDANESCLDQCSENYFQDSTLPCMDIGDFGGM